MIKEQCFTLRSRPLDQCLQFKWDIHKHFVGKYILLYVNALMFLFISLLLSFFLICECWVIMCEFWVFFVCGNHTSHVWSPWSSGLCCSLPGRKLLVQIQVHMIRLSKKCLAVLSRQSILAFHSTIATAPILSQLQKVSTEQDGSACILAPFLYSGWRWRPRVS